MSHTPTPWFVTPAFPATCGDVGITAKGLPNVLAECFENIRHGSEKARDEARSNAAFIVKAVNAHDDLVAALRRISDVTHIDAFDKERPSFEAEIARTALTKAGEL